MGDEPRRAAPAVEFTQRRNFRACSSSAARKTGSADIIGVLRWQAVVSSVRLGNIDSVFCQIDTTAILNWASLNLL